jgi:hypothetical protein
MDPYLEHPALWPNVHHRLISGLSDVLVPLLRPRYFVSVELRVYEAALAANELVGIGDVMVTREPARGLTPMRPQRPDEREQSAVAVAMYADQRTHGAVLEVELPVSVEVREHYLEVRVPRTHELVTTIEVLSPSNKQAGKGRQQYEEKRLAVAETRTNLVEIDLLRGGDPLPVLQRGVPLPRERAGDYRVLVSRGGHRHSSDLHVIALREPLPAIPVPLRPEDDAPLVDLGEVLTAAYDRGGLELLLDYRAEPVPPLSAADAAWADDLLRSRGLR